MIGGAKLDGPRMPFVRSGVRRRPKSSRRPPSTDTPAMPVPGERVSGDELSYDGESEASYVLHIHISHADSKLGSNPTMRLRTSFKCWFLAGCHRRHLHGRRRGSYPIRMTFPSRTSLSRASGKWSRGFRKHRCPRAHANDHTAEPVQPHGAHKVVDRVDHCCAVFFADGETCAPPLGDAQSDSRDLPSLGPLCLIAIPFEATTMAGRRLRDTVEDALSDRLGPVTPIIAGLSNGYCGYLTTREEYALQHYEGASTHFGPNQLVATQQECQRLARAILAERQIDNGGLRPPRNIKYASWQTGVIVDNVPLGNSFGDVLKGKDVKPSYWIGETVTVEFFGAHPKNNFRTEGSYLEVQLLSEQYEAGPEERWETLMWDSHPDTEYEWARMGIDHSRITLRWRIGPDTAQGTYRILHNGDYKKLGLLGGGVFPYSGASGTFQVVDPKAPPVFSGVFDPDAPTTAVAQRRKGARGRAKL